MIERLVYFICLFIDLSMIILASFGLVESVKDKDLGETLYIPRSMLKADEEIFLDNITLQNLSDTMKIEVVPCLNKGQDFVDKILK